MADIDAAQAAHDYEAIRAGLAPVDIDRTTKRLEFDGYFRHISAEATRHVIRGLAFSQTTDADGVGPSKDWLGAFSQPIAKRFRKLSDQQVGEVFARAHDLLATAIGQEIARLATGSGEDSRAYRRHAAEIVLAHARLFAEQRREPSPEPDQWPVQEAAYSLAQAFVLSVTRYIAESLPTEAAGTEFSVTFFTAALDDLFPVAGAPATRTPEIPRPHYHLALPGPWDGRTPSDLLAWQVLQAQWAGAIAWGDRTLMPEIRGDWKQGKSRHSFDGELVSVDAAWEVVDRLGDRHADVLHYLHAKWMANRDDITSGWGIWISIDEILESWGIKEHHKGGHRSQYIDEVERIITDLRLQVVSAEIEADFRTKGKSGTERQRLIRRTPLIVLEEHASRVTLVGEVQDTAWRIKPGAWALESHALFGWDKNVNRAIFALGEQYANAKRIGRFLEQEWRMNAANRQAGRPIVIADLLRRARIELPTSQHSRFRERIEKQIDKLYEVGVIRYWSYPEVVVYGGGRKGFDRWLETTIMLEVPDSLQPKLDEYATSRERRKAIGQRRKQGTRDGAS